MADRHKSPSACVHITIWSDFRLPSSEKKYAEKFDTMKGISRYLGIIICRRNIEAVFIKGKRILSANHVGFVL